MENELIKEAVEYGHAKVDSARSLIAGVMHWAVTTGGFNSETVQDVMRERWNAASATSFRRLQWSG